jgi:hypothetical protein
VSEIYYLTGRERTITIGGAWSFAGDTGVVGTSSYTGNALFAQIGKNYYAGASWPTGVSGSDYFLQINRSGVATLKRGASIDHTWTGVSSSGYWSFSLTVVEAFHDVFDRDAGSTTSNDAWGTGNDTGGGDAYWLEYVEVVKPGSDLVISVGGSSYTVDLTDYSFADFMYYCTGGISASANSHAGATLTATTTGTMLWDGGGFTYQSPDATRSGSYTPASGHTASYSASRNSVTATTNYDHQAFDATGTAFYTVSRWRFTPPQTTRINGRLESINGSLGVAYTAAVVSKSGGSYLTDTVSVDASGLFTKDYTDHDATLSIVNYALATYNYTDSVTTNLPRYGVRLSGTIPDALKASHTWFSGIGKAFNALSVSQNSSFVFSRIASSGNDDTSRWASSFATLTTSGTVLQMATGSDGTLDETARSVTLSTDGRALGYRYIKFRIRSVGAANLPVRIRFASEESFFGGKLAFVYWDITTGADGVWVDRVIDRYKFNRDIDTFTGLPTPAWTWTIDKPPLIVTEMALSNLTENATYELDGVTLTRNETPVLTCLETLYAQTDGILSMEQNLRDLTIAQVPLAPSSWGWGWNIGILNAPRVGKPAPSSLTSPPYFFPGADWHDSDATAQWLGAGGHQESVVLDAAASSYTLKGREMFQFVAFYPAAGDVFGIGAGDYDETTEVTFRQRTRAQMYGAMIDPTTAMATTGRQATFNEIVPMASLTDTPVDVSSSARGSGSPVSPSGRYSSVAPFLTGRPASGDSTPYNHRGNVSPSPGSGYDAILSPPLYGRLWLFWFAPPNGEQGGPLALDSARGWLFVGQGKRINGYHLVNGGLAFASGEHSVDAWAALTYDERKCVLYGIGVSGGSRIVYASRDAGTTIGGGILTVTADTAAIAIDSARNILYLLYAVTGGNIKIRRSRDSGVTWSTAANIKDASAASVAGEVVNGAAVFDARTGGTLTASFKVAGATVVWQSRNEGADWAPLLS